MSDNRPIGIFDSGVGGLTVMREFIKNMPNENIIYFGDTARVPYGSKSKEIVTEYSKQIVNFLKTKDVKMIVIACNTATALAFLDLLEYTDIPIIEVITPGAVSAYNNTKNKKVGIIGTEATVKSRAYEEKIKDLDNTIEVFQKACPLLVPLVEEGWTNKDVTKSVCEEYLSEILDKDVDTIVLGCTHYPLLKDTIEKIAKGVDVINPALSTCLNAKTYLEENDMRSNEKIGSYKIYTSDYTDKFDTICRSILNVSYVDSLLENRQKINIENYTK